MAHDLEVTVESEPKCVPSLHGENRVLDSVGQLQAHTPQVGNMNHSLNIIAATVRLSCVSLHTGFICASQGEVLATLSDPTKCVARLLAT